MLARYLQQLAADAIHADPDRTRLLIPARLYVNIRAAQPVTFDDDAVDQLNDRRGGGGAFLLTVILFLIELQPPLLFQVPEHIGKAFGLLVVGETAAQIFQD